MKLLVIGDPHGKLPKNLDSIIKKNKIEFIICVGDIAFIPKKPWLEESWKGISKRFMNKNYKEIVDKLCSFKLPVLSLRGNMFTEEKKKIADRILNKHKNLINKFTGKYNFQNKNFIFFDVIYEPSTLMHGQGKNYFFKNNMKKNKKRELKLNKLLKENSNAILIAHNPPYGAVDTVKNKFIQNKIKHVGSKILLKAIKKHQPKLVLCGHIHEAKGKTKINKTLIINAGSHGDYVVIDTETNKIIESNFLK